MVDENADRARLTGQQPVPERDIEPLWPPDATDPAQAWGGPSATLYPSLTAEVGRPPATAAWAPPPPDGDWPSLQAEPTAPVVPSDQHGNGTGVTNGYGHPGDPSPLGQPSHPGAPEQLAPVPAPRVGQPAPVDLDLPFTLDQPMTPGASGRAGSGNPAGASDAAWTDPVDSSPPGAAETHPAPVTTAGGQGGAATPSGPGTPVVPVESGTRESPWAQPPQRLSAGGEEAVGSAAVPGQAQDAPPAPK
ncbi:hypothetical protein E1165_28285, partial [Micromonospora sp. KC723]